MSEKTLEERIRVLEDINEIKLLRNSYSYSSNVDGEDMIRQFADNFVADGEFNPGFGVLAGPEAIYEGLQPVSAIFACMMHITTNGSVFVDGDTATGKWTGLFPHVMAGDTKLQWGNCYYYDEYVRTPDGWKFKSVNAKSFFFSQSWCDIFTTFLDNNRNCLVAR